MTARPFHGAHGQPWAAPGVAVSPLVPPNPLWTANGIAFGGDGRLWIAEFNGGTVSRLDLATGALERMIGVDGPLTAPDDIAVEPTPAGDRVYVVDLPAGLVWCREPDGAMRVVASGVDNPDGVTVHRGRLFVNELVPGGRLMEIDLAGGPPRVLASDLVMGNAMEVGPDGLLYYPHTAGGLVSRIDPEGGTPETVLSGLPLPVAVRFDAAGLLHVFSNDDHGTLTTVDLTVFDPVEPEEGGRTVRETGVFGGDNLAVGPGGVLYLSSAFGAGLWALHPDGRSEQVVPGGLLGPHGLAAGPEGALWICDQYSLRVLRAGELRRVGGHQGIPGDVRGLTWSAGELHLTSGRGVVHSGDPGCGTRQRAAGLRGPTGVLGTPAGLLVAESGAGRVVRIDATDGLEPVLEGLDRPTDLTGHAGEVWVTDAGRGQVRRLSDGAVVAAGLARPEGIAALDGALWVVEAAAGRLTRLDPVSRATEVVATGLPTATPPPHVPDHGLGTVPVARPIPFAAVEAFDGGLAVGGTGVGSVLRVTLGPR